MSSFPQDPRELGVELYLGSAWVDVFAAGDVREGSKITIARGRRNEGSSAEPSSCAFTLDNTNDDYSPRNPLGPYYGQFGRNTPLRVTLPLLTDDYTRTVASGWGTAPDGQAWSTDGLGGTVSASDWSVSSGKGVMSVPAADAYRAAYLAARTYRTVDVAVSVSLAITDITGGAVEPANILLAGLSTSDYYIVRVRIEADQSVTVAVVYTDGFEAADQVTVPGLTFTGQTLRVRAQLEHETIRAKVWDAAGDEPYGWHTSGHDGFLADNGLGWVGVRSGVAAGNTNTKPVVFTYDDFRLRLPRFAGELSAVQVDWDTSENNITTAVEAAGIMRRLGQGAASLDSALYRGITRLATPAVGYWPCEDGAAADRIASGIPGGSAMNVVSGAAKFASYSGIAASKPLPGVNGSVWVGNVNPYTPTGEAQLRYLTHIPASGIVDLGIISTLHTNGTGGNWEIKYRTGGGLSLEVWSAGVQLLDSGALALAVDDKDIMISLELTQDGSDIDWALATLELGQSTGLVYTGTLNSRTIGAANAVTIAPYAELDDQIPIGHISVLSEVTSLFDLNDQLAAWRGETALDRLARLCAEEGIAFSERSGDGTSALMGAQLPKTLLDLAMECAATDLGTLYEPLGEVGLAYRSLSATYNRPAAVTLDYSAEQVAPPFRPVDDDQLSRNSVTARRTDGGSAVVEQTTGRLSVKPADEGGVGRYAVSVEVNTAADDQLDDIAGWLVHLGTVDETRYPQISIDLASAEISSDAALSADVLQLDVDDRIVVTNPRVGQTPNDISQIARGYTETIGSFDHKLVVNTAPASPYQVVELDDSDARYDTDGSDLSADVSSSATSFTVDVPSGPLWTTDPDDMPLLITIGGERMSVGAVSGTSSPQTFSSVTRSVNGIVKAHSAGAAVVLTTPPVWAL